MNVINFPFLHEYWKCWSYGAPYSVQLISQLGNTSRIICSAEKERKFCYGTDRLDERHPALPKLFTSEKKFTILLVLKYKILFYYNSTVATSVLLRMLFSAMNFLFLRNWNTLYIAVLRLISEASIHASSITLKWNFGLFLCKSKRGLLAANSHRRSGNSSLPESGTSCRRQLPADTNGGGGKGI